MIKVLPTSKKTPISRIATDLVREKAVPGSGPLGGATARGGGEVDNLAVIALF